jgi:hypothetical protein
MSRPHIHRTNIASACCPAAVSTAAAGSPVYVQRSAEDGLRKNASPFEISLCLSRACLGKTITFSAKSRKRFVFHTSSIAESESCSVSMVSVFLGFVPSLAWQIQNMWHRKSTTRSFVSVCEFFVLLTCSCWGGWTSGGMTRTRNETSSF